MPIKLPDLETKTYQDLWSETRAAIPQYSSTWTDYNDSDPGVTILQLLSWVAETLLYRINSVPEAFYINVLRLVAGAAEDEVEKLLAQLQDQVVEIQIQGRNDTYYAYLDNNYIKLLRSLKGIKDGTLTVDSLDIQKQLLKFLKSPYRAITQTDFETVAIETTQALLDKDFNPIKDSPFTIERAIASSVSNGVEVVIVWNGEATSPAIITTKKQVAHAIFDKYPGKWQVRQVPANRPAQTFWRKVMADYTKDGFVERTNAQGGAVQRFESQNPRTRECC